MGSNPNRDFFLTVSSCLVIILQLLNTEINLKAENINILQKEVQSFNAF